MNNGLASLHKILKDETRSKIILLLQEKGSLSYSDLMETLSFSSTGTLNYHLKVLGDLLTKNDTGKYVLSEKGKLGCRILTEFPEESNQLQKRKRQKQFWTIAALGQVALLISILMLYFLKYLDFVRLVQSIVGAVGGIFLALFAYRMQSTMPAPRSKEEKSRFKKAYILLGSWVGLVLAFFGTIFLSIISVNLGGPNLLRIINEPWEIISLIIVLTIIGAVAGYYLGKRNNFEKPKWMAKIDEKLGF